jgi:NADH-quinone oxidoreductase subunit K
MDIVKFLSVFLVALSVVGIAWNFNNLIKIFVSIELMFLAVCLNFVAYACELGDIHGQLFTVFVLTVAAAESALGLALFIVYFRQRSTASVADATLLKE